MNSKIICSIDGIRFDKIFGSYGDKTDLAPNIKNLSEQSVVYTNLYAAATSTGMCFSSLFTGEYNAKFGRKNYGDNINPFQENVFSMASDQGLLPIICLNARFEPHYRLINCFDAVDHWWTGQKSVSSKDDSSLNPKDQIEWLLQRIKQRGIKSFFVWIHLWGFSKPDPKFSSKIPFEYDARIAQLDDAIGLLMGQAKRSNWDLYVLSDHGYSFFENHSEWGYGKDGENHSAAVCNVPLICFNGSPPGINQNLVSQTSFKHIVFNSQDILAIEDEFAFCESRYPGQAGATISLRYKNWKMVRNSFGNICGFYDVDSDRNCNINYVGTKFYRVQREGSSHADLKPYIVRCDWNSLFSDFEYMRSQINSFYDEFYANDHSSFKELVFLLWKKFVGIKNRLKRKLAMREVGSVL